jgi:putative component of toxin-antitoxin plasmid stabilization module
MFLADDTAWDRRTIALIPTLYLDAKLEKQLQALHRAGKKAALAAERAQSIIARLEAGKFSSIEAGALTKNGELRIKGCLKYDLGSGYRMVTLKQGRDLYVLYIGSHDDCHRWIENNRELPIADIQRRSRRILVENPHNHMQCNNTDRETKGCEEPNAFSEELDDRHLRAIFSGLIQSVQNTDTT